MRWQRSPLPDLLSEKASARHSHAWRLLENSSIVVRERARNEPHFVQPRLARHSLRLDQYFATAAAHSIGTAIAGTLASRAGGGLRRAGRRPASQVLADRVVCQRLLRVADGALDEQQLLRDLLGGRRSTVGPLQGDG